MMMGWAAAWLLKAWLVNAAAAQDVAHCIVGGFRTLGEPEVHIKMRENFIDGVGGTNVELFLYVDLGVELSAKGSWTEHSQTELDRAAHYLRYGFNISAPPPTPSPRVYKATVAQHRQPRDVGIRCGELCTGQFYKWVRCYDMVTRAEKRRGKSFDWIIRHRPDMLWHQTARPIATLPLEPFWNVDRQLYLPRSELDAARAIGPPRRPRRHDAIDATDSHTGEVDCDGCEKKLGRLRRAKSCWCLHAKVLKQLTFSTTIKHKATRSKLFNRPSIRAPPRLDNASFQMFSNDFKRTPEAQQLLDAVGEQALHGRTVQDALRRNMTGAWVAPDAENDPPRSFEPNEQGLSRRRLPRPRKRSVHREKKGTLAGGVVL